MKKIISILLIAFSIASQAKEVKLSCVFPNEEGTIINDCAVKSKDGHFQIVKKVLKKIKFDEAGLAGGTIANEGCFWANKKGVTEKTYCFDNGADYFVDDLARYIDAKGLIGFMNKKLKVIIPAQYTFAFPFEYSFAKVCNACKVKKIDKSEHSKVTGGKWFIIDPHGNVVKTCSKAQEEYQCNLDKAK